MTPAVRAQGKEATHSPQVRANPGAAGKGRPLHPNSLAALEEPRSRPKSETSKRAISNRSTKMRENPEADGPPAPHTWTEAELALIGTGSDLSVANALGLPFKLVAYKRRRMRIPLLVQRWTEHELALLGRASDYRISRTLGKSHKAIRRKREKLGIPTFARKPWSEAEIALLGKEPDYELGRKFARPTTSVRFKRTQLGIPAFSPRWQPAETALLGNDTDQNIAKLLNRTEAAVKQRRLESQNPCLSLRPCRFQIRAANSLIPVKSLVEGNDRRHPGSQRCARWSNQYQAARHSRKSAAPPRARLSRNGRTAHSRFSLPRTEGFTRCHPPD